MGDVATSVSVAKYGDDALTMKARDQAIAAIDDAKATMPPPAFDGEVAQGNGEKTQYSIRTLPDGRKYVDVDTDQSIFDGAEGYDVRRIAHDYIIKHFRGKVIGVTNRAYVRNESERKFLYPNKTPDKTILNAIWRASPELHNLIEAREYLDFFPDEGDHNHGPDVYGFDKYRTVFHVNGVWIEGVLNVKVTKTGDIFYGISKTKNITSRPTVPTLETQSYRTGNDVSATSISDSEGFDKPQTQKSLRSPVTDTPAFRKWFGDSKVVNDDGTPKVMYHGTNANESFTVFDTYGGKFGLFGIGSYFTDDRSVAESYTSKGKGNNPRGKNGVAAASRPSRLRF